MHHIVHIMSNYMLLVPSACCLQRSTPANSSHAPAVRWKQAVQTSQEVPTALQDATAHAALGTSTMSLGALSRAVKVGSASSTFHPSVDHHHTFYTHCQHVPCTKATNQPRCQTGTTKQTGRALQPPRAWVGCGRTTNYRASRISIFTQRPLCVPYHLSVLFLCNKKAGALLAASRSL